MFSLETNSLMTLYLAVTLFFIAFLWLKDALQNARKKKIPPIKQLITCEYCTFVYLAQSQNKVSQCPQCCSFNKRTYTNPRKKIHK